MTDDSQTPESGNKMPDPLSHQQPSQPVHASQPQAPSAAHPAQNTTSQDAPPSGAAPRQPTVTAKKRKKKNSKKKPSSIPAFLSLIFLLMLIASCALVWVVDSFLSAGPLRQQHAVMIHKGSSLTVIADKLEKENVIRHPLIFRAGAVLLGYANTLKAGEFMFPARVSQRQVLDILRQGKTLQHFVTIPEGYTTAQIIDLLQKNEILTGNITDIPAEGSLLPETYSFSRGDTRSDIVLHMYSAMQDTLKELWDNRQPDLPYTSVREALTMASIIEKETGIAEERKRVAGVFVNRLRQGIPLQSDPTVIYAITKGKKPLGRPLNRQDWKIQDPYNTYANPGLPPGPIANPGRASIEAALNPEQHNYLFFVADGTGGHVFAETLDEHNRNVAKWRKIRDGNTPPDGVQDGQGTQRDTQSNPSHKENKPKQEASPSLKSPKPGRAIAPTPTAPANLPPLPPLPGQP